MKSMSLLTKIKESQSRNKDIALIRKLENSGLPNQRQEVGNEICNMATIYKNFYDTQESLDNKINTASLNSQQRIAILKLTKHSEKVVNDYGQQRALFFAQREHSKDPLLNLSRVEILTQIMKTVGKILDGEELSELELYTLGSEVNKKSFLDQIDAQMQANLAMGGVTLLMALTTCAALSVLNPILSAVFFACALFVGLIMALVAISLPEERSVGYELQQFLASIMLPNGQISDLKLPREEMFDDIPNQPILCC